LIAWRHADGTRVVCGGDRFEALIQVKGLAFSIVLAEFHALAEIVVSINYRMSGVEVIAHLRRLVRHIRTHWPMLTVFPARQNTH
jgi:hypothetical protein